jgi:hypothetical protein
VVTDVTPIVAERVGGQIATQVTNEVVKQAEPLIRDNVTRAIATSVEPRIATATNALRQDITNLQTTAQKTSEFVAAARNDQEGLRRDLATEREFTRALPREMNQTMAKELESNREVIAGLTRRISAMEAELKKLQVRVTAIDAAKATRTPR